MTKVFLVLFKFVFKHFLISFQLINFFFSLLKHAFTPINIFQVNVAAASKCCVMDRKRKKKLQKVRVKMSFFGGKMGGDSKHHHHHCKLDATKSFQLSSGKS